MAIAVVVLVAYLVPTLIQLRKSIQKVESLTGSLEQRLPAIAENVEVITHNLSDILQKGHSQMEVINGTVQQLKSVVDDVVEVEKSIKHHVDTKLVRSLVTVSAGIKAVHTFMQVLQNGEHQSNKKKRRFLFRRRE